MKTLKTGDWIKLFARSNPAKVRIEANGPYWVVEDIFEDRIKLRSSQRTFGSKNAKRYDGVVIWKENDPNFDWSV